MPMNADTTRTLIVPVHSSGEQRNIPHMRGEVNREPPIGTPGHDLCVTGRCTDRAEATRSRAYGCFAKITKRAKRSYGRFDSLGSFLRCTHSQRGVETGPAYKHPIDMAKGTSSASRLSF